MQQLRTLLNEEVAPYITNLPQRKIDKIIHGFGEAAELAVKAGFDMVQIHGDRMCGSFSSSVFNHRTDAYGGSAENRARFAVEAVRAVRSRLPELPIDYKLAVRQEDPHYGNAGVLESELGIFVPLLVEAGVTSFPGTPEPGSYYLCLSELVSYKRVDLAVEACTRTGRRLVVAGDGPERKRLESIAGPTVSFVGRVDNAALPALYAGCKAFLFPGEEDFGITPLEAIAAGRPVIAYGRGGVLDSVADGETGIFFERQTADALTEALDAYEASTEQTWVHDKLKRQAESFSEEIFRKKMIAFIADVLENKV